MRRFVLHIEFSFAFVAAAALIVIFVWKLRLGGNMLKMTVWSTFPGLLLSVAIAGEVLWRWPSGELWYGSKSFPEMFRSISGPSFAGPDPAVVGISIAHAVASNAPTIPAFVGIVVVGYVLWLLLPKPSQERASQFAFVFSTILAVALILHGFAYLSFHLLLPKGRTGLFIIPLFTLVVGSLAAIPATNRISRLLRVLTVSALVIIFGFYIAGIRYSFFEEWRWNSDVAEAYNRVRDLKRRGYIRTVGSSWYYVPSLNFYREMYGTQEVEEFVVAKDLPQSRDLYCLHPILDREFISKQYLKIIFTGREGELVLASSPACATKGTSTEKVSSESTLPTAKSVR